jgi:hypothetical protein
MSDFSRSVTLSARGLVFKVLGNELLTTGLGLRPYVVTSKLLTWSLGALAVFSTGRDPVIAAPRSRMIQLRHHAQGRTLAEIRSFNSKARDSHPPDELVALAVLVGIQPQPNAVVRPLEKSSALGAQRDIKRE